MPNRKGEMEDRISKAVTQWEKEYLGRGPLSVKTDILRNMVIIVLKGILTPAERKLAKSNEGLLSIKKIRMDLIETGNDDLKALVEEIIEVPIGSFHTDVSTKTGERVIVLMLHEHLEEKLRLADQLP